MSKSIRIDADELLSCFETLQKRAWNDDTYEVAVRRGYLAAMTDAIHLVEYRKRVEERLQREIQITRLFRLKEEMYANSNT